MSFKKHVPNIFTLLNLVCGSIAVVFLTSDSLPINAGWLIFIAAFFDLSDGAIARALGVSGELGKQLDSLADVVSFGLAPSAMIYQLLTAHSYEATPLAAIAIINVCCAAIRLARFNISTDQKHDFSGMPSPANGILWASIFIANDWLMNSTFISDSSLNILITCMAVISSWLMVSRIRMFSFKLQPGGFITNKIPFIFIGVVLLITASSLIFTHGIIPALPLCLIAYILMSFVYHFSKQGNQS